MKGDGLAEAEVGREGRDGRRGGHLGKASGGRQGEKPGGQVRLEAELVPGWDTINMQTGKKDGISKFHLRKTSRLI